MVVLMLERVELAGWLDGCAFGFWLNRVELAGWLDGCADG